jgi:hypothetical protein
MRPAGQFRHRLATASAAAAARSVAVGLRTAACSATDPAAVATTRKQPAVKTSLSVRRRRAGAVKLVGTADLAAS